MARKKQPDQELDGFETKPVVDPPEEAEEPQAEEPQAEEPQAEEPQVEFVLESEPSAPAQDQDEVEQPAEELPAWAKPSAFEIAAERGRLEASARRILNSYVSAGVMKTKDRMARLKKEHPALFAAYTASLTPEQVADLLPEKKK